MNNQRLLLEVEAILKYISKAVEAERSTFFLLDNKKLVLNSIVAQGLENIKIALPIINGIAGRVARQGISFLENDVQNNPFFDDHFDKLFNFVSKSIICAPVFNQQKEVIGVLQCLNKKGGDFVKKDISALIGFSASISLIVKNTLLYEASENLKNNYATLLDVFATVSSELDLDNLIQLIMLKAAEVTKSDRSSLFFMDEDTNELWTKYAKGLDTKTVRTKKGIVGLVARDRKPYIVNDPYNHEAFDSSVDLETGYNTKSILSVPVFNSKNRILGVIQVINKIEGVFEPADQAILEGFAGQIRIAIENAQLFNQINGMKNYLNILVENLDNGIVTIDGSHTIQTINNAFYRMFDLEGTNSLANARISELSEDLKSILTYSKNTIETGIKHYEYGIEYQTQKLKKITTNLSILPMHDPNGEIIGAVNVFQDVTKERRIRSNLSRYIPKHLINEVINKDDLSILQSKSRKCSILFSDIRNFTKLTEELGAIQIVELLNKYFDAMVTTIQLENGILDKFIGDAVMAVFGVPYTNTSDAHNAVQCALIMFGRLEELNQQKNVGVNLNIGIGISTGNVIAGNIGSEKRFEYTVIGDPVNLAARLENETKKYKVRILICENTYRNVSDSFHCREIDSVNIRGKQNEVKIYAVDGEVGKTFNGYSTFCNHFSEGLQAFRSKEYIIAKKKFRKAFAIQKKDGPTQLFLKRCDDVLGLSVYSRTIK